MDKEQKVKRFTALPWSWIEQELSVRDSDKYFDAEEHSFTLCRQVWHVYNG